MPTHLTSLLQGNRALVIGGGRGIGRAVSLALAAHGADVAIGDLENDRAESVAAEVQAFGGRGVPLCADVRSRQSIDGLVSDAAAAFGGIDTLVTVVGGTWVFAPFQHLHEFSDEQYDTMVDMNVRYVFRAVRAVLPIMLEQQRGSIVSIGSISGLHSAPRHAPYGVAKAGVSNLTASVAAEYGQHGIRMNVVAPGLVETPASAGAHDAEQIALMRDRIPLGRRAYPEEIADAVVFFASPLARYVTGQSLLVDGGLSTRYPVPMQTASPSEAS